MTTIAEYTDQAYEESWPIEKTEQMAEALEAIERMHTGVPGSCTVASQWRAVRCRQCGTLSPCNTLRTIHDVLSIDGKDDTE